MTQSMDTSMYEAPPWALTNSSAAHRDPQRVRGGPPRQLP